MRVLKFYWDGRCPACKEPINYDHLCQQHVSHDYETEFLFDCPHCKAEIEADVRCVPEFGLAVSEIATPAATA